MCGADVSPSGFYADLAHILSESLNFKLINKRSIDCKFGAPLITEECADPVERKCWNGLVKMVMDKKADIILSGMTATVERNKVLDFSLIQVRQ